MRKDDYDSTAGAILRPYERRRIRGRQEHLHSQYQQVPKESCLVSQEPTLYQGTIRDNLLLGTKREDVPEDEIIFACKEANVYDFVMSLP